TEDQQMPSAMTAPSASLIEEKAAFRGEMGRRRRKLAAADAPCDAGANAADLFFAHVKLEAGAIVSAYWPMGDELDPRPLIRRIQAAGHTIGLPVVVARGAPLIFRDWAPETRFIAGGFKTEVPEPSAPEVVPTLLLVPLLAFDLKGYRL